MMEIRITQERLSEKPICRYIFGNFIESGFGRQTSGMWAEMLYNRSFVQVPPYKESTWEALRLDPDHFNASAPYWHSGYDECDWELLAPGYSKKWRTHGTDSFKGCGSLIISNDSNGKRTGLRQSGIYFQSGRRYKFSIFGGFAVYWGKKVSPPLVRDETIDSRVIETRIVDITLREEGNDHNILFHSQLRFSCLQRQFDLDILLPGYTGRAVLEISFNWQGDLLLSWCSLMPMDNIKGWRSDVIACLKEISPPIIRFPGGCFASFSDWRNAVGLRHQRVPTESYFWGGLDDNDVGIDEYLDLCLEIGAEPQVCVNMMTSTPFKAAELVEYCNGADSSSMGRFRNENGTVRDRKVIFWEMENEPSRKWSALQYAQKVVEFARAMRSVDPKIRLMMAYYDFDASLYWLPQMLEIAGKHIDYVIHRERSKSTIEQALNILRDYNREHGTDIQHVNTEWLADPDAPEPFEDINIPQKYDFLDVWNDYKKTISLRQISWFYALNAALTLLDFISLGGEFSLANFNNCVNTWGQNIIEASKEGAWLSPAGHVFKFFKNFNGKFPLRTEINPAENVLVRSQGCETDDREFVVYMVNRGKDPQRIVLILPEGISAKSSETIFALSQLSTCHLGSCEILSEQATITSQNSLTLKPLSLTKVECQKNRRYKVAPPTVSGKYYDWTITKKPERPWIHQYHQTFVDKIYLASKANPQTGEPPIVYFTFEQALERIKQIDQVTRGIPKIIYLVGWQYDGHDSRYPDWGEVNDRLKRYQDPTARDSLIWLMEEGRRYNAIISLHINMLDAYEDAPSWNAYLEKNIIVKKEGQLYRHPRAVWGGQQAYWIDYAKEWEASLAQKRIDDLLAMLPIQKQGTIHIDAFGIPLYTDSEEEKIAMRRIFRYWRDKGVDVTSENVYDWRYGDGFIGLQPMSWHINPIHGGWKYSLENPEIREEMWMEIPASLCCGGVDEIDQETGGLFGSSMHGETILDVNDFIKPFCLQTLPWYFMNRFARLNFLKDGQVRTLYLSDRVISRVEKGCRTISHGNRLIVDGDDVFIPALWGTNKEIISYSSQGYLARKWELPEDWNKITIVDIYEISKNGSKYLRSLEIEAGKLDLSMEAGQAVSIVPKGTHHDLTEEL